MLLPPLVGGVLLSCSKYPIARELALAAAVEHELCTHVGAETLHVTVCDGGVVGEVRPLLLLERVGFDQGSTLLPQLVKHIRLLHLCMGVDSVSEAL